MHDVAKAIKPCSEKLKFDEGRDREHHNIVGVLVPPRCDLGVSKRVFESPMGDLGRL